MQKGLSVRAPKMYPKLLEDDETAEQVRRFFLRYKRIDGAGDGTRTHDILLGKQTLYQLSYTRIAASGVSIRIRAATRKRMTPDAAHESASATAGSWRGASGAARARSRGVK